MTIFGWDMSHYDAITSDLAVRVSGDGIGFVTHKAGGDSNDAEIGAWWSAFRSFRDRLLLGAYWVLYPGSPAARADAFLARLDATCPGWRDGPFILQADCEKWNGDPGTVPSRAEIAAFCDRLVARMPKLRPIVYAPAWVYGDKLAGLGYPLWASAYVTGSGSFKALYPGDKSGAWGAYSGQTPAILQYSSSATIGGQTTSDANAFRGTLAQLTDLVAPGWSDDMPISEPEFARIQAMIRAPYADADPTALVETPAGHSILSQQTPNGTKPGSPQEAFYAVVEDLGVQLVALQAQVAALSSVTIDYAALAQALAAAFPVQLADQVADVLAQRLSA